MNVGDRRSALETILTNQTGPSNRGPAECEKEKCADSADLLLVDASLAMAPQGSSDDIRNTKKESIQSFVLFLCRCLDLIQLRIWCLTHDVDANHA